MSLPDRHRCSSYQTQPGLHVYTDNRKLRYCGTNCQANQTSQSQPSHLRPQTHVTELLARGRRRAPFRNITDPHLPIKPHQA